MCVRSQARASMVTLCLYDIILGLFSPSQPSLLAFSVFCLGKLVAVGQVVAHKVMYGICHLSNFGN